MPGEIRIDQEAVRSLVAKGIIESLGGDQQQLILEQAVEGLLKDNVDNYGKTKPGSSPLAYAFQQQVNAVARDIVKDYLETPEMKARLAKAVQDGVDKVMTGDLMWLDEAIANGIGDQIKLVAKERWEKR